MICLLQYKAFLALFWASYCNCIKIAWFAWIFMVWFPICFTRISKVGKCIAFQLWTPTYFLSIEDENCNFLREIDAKLETLKNYLAQQNGKRSRNLSFNQIMFSKYGKAKEQREDASEASTHTVLNIHFSSKHSTSSVWKSPKYLIWSFV